MEQQQVVRLWAVRVLFPYLTPLAFSLYSSGKGSSPFPMDIVAKGGKKYVTMTGLAAYLKEQGYSADEARELLGRVQQQEVADTAKGKGIWKQAHQKN